MIYTISAPFYSEVAGALREAVGCRDYFSGSIGSAHPGTAASRPEACGPACSGNAAFRPEEEGAGPTGTEASRPEAFGSAAGAEYYAGSIEEYGGEVSWRLTATLLIYRAEVQAPDGAGRPLRDAVPVWWEFHTWVGGEEVLNDFSFDTLRTWLR